MRWRSGFSCSLCLQSDVKDVYLHGWWVADDMGVSVGEFTISATTCQMAPLSSHAGPFLSALQICPPGRRRINFCLPLRATVNRCVLWATGWPMIAGHYTRNCCPQRDVMGDGGGGRGSFNIWRPHRMGEGGKKMTKICGQTIYIFQTKRGKE